MLLPGHAWFVCVCVCVSEWGPVFVFFCEPRLSRVDVSSLQGYSLVFGTWLYFGLLFIWLYFGLLFTWLYVVFCTWLYFGFIFYIFVFSLLDYSLFYTWSYFILCRTWLYFSLFCTWLYFFVFSVIFCFVWSHFNFFVDSIGWSSLKKSGGSFWYNCCCLLYTSFPLTAVFKMFCKSLLMTWHFIFSDADILKW